MNTSSTLTKQQWQDQEALGRFQLISPLLQPELDDAKRFQLRRKIAEENREVFDPEKIINEKRD